MNQGSMPGIPCIGCGACRDCPMELNIPYIFTALNEYFASGDQEKLAPILELPGEQQPRGCVGCGLCQERCPEHIDASGWMLKARTLLESVER